MISHEQNQHSHTLSGILRHIEASRSKAVKQAVCDRDYRAKREINNTKIILSEEALKRDSRYQKIKSTNNAEDV